MNYYPRLVLSLVVLVAGLALLLWAAQPILLIVLKVAGGLALLYIAAFLYPSYRTGYYGAAANRRYRSR